MKTLNAAEQARIEEAVGQAEQRTSAEFALAVAQAADRYEAYPMLWAALAALITGGAIAVIAPWAGTTSMFAAQAIVFVALGIVLYLAPVRHWLVPASVREEEATKLAQLQFAALVQQRTDAQVGLLMFVSLAEHHIEIIVDKGIAERVPQDAWAEIVDEFAGRVRSGALADGFVGAIERCTVILEREFPPGPTDRNEMPNSPTLL
jgi:putative membrane protein